MLRPLGNNVIVRRIEEATIGNIVMADKARKNISLVVVAKGPNVRHVEIDDHIICVPLDCQFFIGFAGLDPMLGVVPEDKIRAVV